MNDTEAQFMIDDTTFVLPEDQYYPEEYPKLRIGLHHTVGGSAESTFNWWKQTQARVGTAFQLARGGIIYEHFPAAAWAWQWGLKGVPRPERVMFERGTIGIELSSEGGLVERDGDLYAFDGLRKLGSVDELFESGAVVRFEDKWRGYEWFDSYDDAQLDSLWHLIAYLTGLYDIERALPDDDILYGAAAPGAHMDFRGILPHTVMRADKSDLHPMFPWEHLRDLLNA